VDGAAHALEAAAALPLLALTSPEKRCGKMTTLSPLAWCRALS
jgi:hypothetical protein